MKSPTLLIQRHRVSSRQVEALIDRWTSEVVSTSLLLSRIIDRRIESQETARPALKETIAFLWLCAHSDCSLTPSRRIDAVWHEFILFTRMYASFCHEHLGSFVHHQPDNDGAMNAARYQDTINQYRQSLGEPDSAFWPAPDGSADCGHCEAKE